jgi:hypothetical protein
MGSLDRWLPHHDVRERHSRRLSVEPRRALAALLATPVGCDRLTRALLAARGLRTGTLSIGQFFEAAGFSVLERTETAVVVGASGRPWRPSGGLGPFEEARPGTVRIASVFRAEPVAGGSVLSTETRVFAADKAARRAFRRYWLLVGPFSGLIRRRWLAAAARRAGL